MIITTALEQPRRALDRHIPAKLLALACVCVTSWETIRTSPLGRHDTTNGDKDSFAMHACAMIHNFHFLPDSRTLSDSISPCILPWKLTLRTNWNNSKWASTKHEWNNESPLTYTNKHSAICVLCRSTVRGCGRWWETGSIICTKLFMDIPKKFWLKGPMQLCLTSILVESATIK